MKSEYDLILLLKNEHLYLNIIFILMFGLKAPIILIKRNQMRYSLLFIILIVFSSVINAQDIVSSIEHNGLNRSYRLFIPSSYVEGSTSMPLVFNFHGLTSQAVEQEFYTNMKPIAEAEGFILCHPEGIDNSWNVGFGGSSVDDVGFVNAMIDEFHTTYDINLRRVYSTGMSNGGYMSYLLACDLTDRIAAIASVTGSMVPLSASNCNPTRPIPVMQIHGTADPTVPYLGSNFALAQESLVDWWVQHNACDAAPGVIDIPDTNTDDGCTAELFEYSGCNEGTAVQFYKVTGGGHTWPGAGLSIGVTNQDFTASQVIWDFFNQYELPVELVKVDVLNNDIEMNVAPNPFKDELNIIVEGQKIESIQIFDLLGKEILNVQGSQETVMSLSTNKIETGAYILKVKIEGGILTQKMIKQ